MTDSRHILVLSRDRGSMQAILPVALSLSSVAAVKVSVVAMEVSRTLCERQGISAEYLPSEEFQDDPVGVIGALLKRYQPSLILSGSSPARGPLPETPEQYAIVEGHRQGIPSVAVLDFWGMYHERFVAEGDQVSLDLLPDVLCVLDICCQTDLLALGVPASRMRVTHNPWLDSVARESLAPPVPSPLTQGVSGLCVVFVSQPLAETGGGRHWPYDQNQVLTFLLNALPVSSDMRHRILVWPHPAERPGRWVNVALHGRSDVEVIVTEERGASVLAHVDLVAGSHSTLLYEALYHGTPVVSLRPVNNCLSSGQTDKLGLSLPFEHPGLLAEYLAKMNPKAERFRLLKEKQVLLAKRIFFSDGEATRRVTDILLRQLSLSADSAKEALV